MDWMQRCRFFFPVFFWCPEINQRIFSSSATGAWSHLKLLTLAVTFPLFSLLLFWSMSYQNPPGAYGSPAHNYQRPPGGQQGYAASPQYGRPQQQGYGGAPPPPGQGYGSPVQQQNQAYPPQNYGKKRLRFMNLKQMSITRVDLDRSSCPTTSRPTTRCQPSALELVQGRWYWQLWKLDCRRTSACTCQRRLEPFQYRDGPKHC